MDRLSLKNNRLKFKSAGKLLTILEESPKVSSTLLEILNSHIHFRQQCLTLTLICETCSILPTLLFMTNPKENPLTMFTHANVLKSSLKSSTCHWFRNLLYSRDSWLLSLLRPLVIKPMSKIQCERRVKKLQVNYYVKVSSTFSDVLNS